MGIPFLSHVFAQLFSHALFDVKFNAKRDLWIDDHYTKENDVITLGLAFAQSVASKKGIFLFGRSAALLLESLVKVMLEVSGPSHTSYSL